MRKIFYLTTVYLLLQSCSSAESETSSAAIIGKWEFYKMRTFPVGTTINGNEELYILPQKCFPQISYLRFGSEGSLKHVDYDNSCFERISLGNYTFSDFILNLNFTQGYYSEMEDTWEVLNLTNSTLTIMALNGVENPGEINVLEFIKVQ